MDSEIRPSPTLPPELVAKRDRLLAILRACGSVAVAYSGGVDSAVVAKAAAVALGEHAVAVTAVSPSLASGELELAQQCAARIGIRHEVLSTEEFLDPRYRANAGDRCFFCKDELYTQLGSWLTGRGIAVICNGANVDDQGDHRPGMQAAADHSVRSPLIEAGITKDDVRALARDWDLPVWDKPASPCLSSRIAYGVEVTPERVQRVDAAEAWLKNYLSIRELRVRLEANDLARIEVPLDALSRVADPEVISQLVPAFKQLGFRRVTLDLDGFRSGSLNADLTLVSLVSYSPEQK